MNNSEAYSGLEFHTGKGMPGLMSLDNSKPPSLNQI